MQGKPIPWATVKCCLNWKRANAASCVLVGLGSRSSAAMIVTHSVASAGASAVCANASMLRECDRRASVGSGHAGLRQACSSGHVNKRAHEFAGPAPKKSDGGSALGPSVCVPSYVDLARDRSGRSHSQPGCWYGLTGRSYRRPCEAQMSPASH